MTKRRPAIERMMQRTEVVADGCWLYRGRLKDGYAYVWGDEAKCAIGHRVAYESLVGPIPADMEIDHLCRVRNCINPAHLEAVTQDENKRRTTGLRYNKTHCPQGHAYDDANVYLAPSGDRMCRICKSARQIASRAAKKLVSV